MKKQFFKNAFTLVEVLITTVILTVVFTGLIKLIINCTTLSKSAESLTYAIGEAQSKIEEIKNSSYDNVVSNYDNTTFNLNAISGGTGKIKVSEIGADVVSDLLEVDLSINWDDTSGRARSTVLRALIPRK